MCQWLLARYLALYIFDESKPIGSASYSKEESEQEGHRILIEEANQEDKSHFHRLMPSIMEPPKFITCPACGDRYDNERKRRLIDTCGHPRCYSCLFVDKPCPLCSKIPQARSSPPNAELHEDESAADKNSSLKPSRGLSKKHFTGSQPNLNDIRKARSATLPHSAGFRTDNYFRSLYRYDPHNSQEYINSLNVKPRTQGVQNYHKSLENLTEQFWQSVERAGGTRSTSPSDDVSSNEGTTRLVVPPDRPGLVAASSESKGQNRRSLPLKDEVLRRLGVEAPDSGRPRSHSHSDLQSRHYERRNERPRSFSPTQLNNHDSSRESDSDRGRPQSISDRSSDVSIPFSDSWSESSGDSDHVTPRSPPPMHCLPKRWSYDESQHERHRRNGELPHTIEAHSEWETRSKKNVTKNPLDGVIYWVVDPPKKPAPSVQEPSSSRNEHLAGADGSENTLKWSSAHLASPKVTTL